VLDAAAEDADTIRRDGEARASSLRADARERRDALVEAALAVVLPSVDADEA
jgi:hypothetical protein